MKGGGVREAFSGAKLLLLDNGVRLAHYRVESESAAICIAAKAGSSYEPEGLWGLSHLLEHMLFRSNEYLGSGELDRIIELSGGEANGFTTRDLILVCAECVPESLPRVAESLYLAVAASEVYDDELEAEKRIVASEARGYQSNPETRIFRLASKSLWGESHLGRPIEGYPETIMRITAGDLLSFKASAFRPDNVSVALAGAVSREAVDSVARVFSRLEARGERLRDPGPVKARPARIEEERGLEAGYAALALPLPGRLDLLSDLPRLRGVRFNLEAGATSVLFRELREERDVAYGYTVDVSLTFWGSTMTVVASEVDVERLSSALEALEEAVRIAFRGSYRGEEWVRGRRLLYRFATRKEAVSNMERADVLSVTSLLYGEPVTLEDLNNATLSVEWSYPLPGRWGVALLR